MHRSSLYVVGAIISINLILFILASRFLFLDLIHHHWILPFEAGIVGAQYVLVSRRAPLAWRSAAKRTLLVLLALVCLIGVARFETVSTCSEGCVPKLVAAFLLAGLAFLLGRNNLIGFKTRKFNRSPTRRK